MAELILACVILICEGDLVLLEVSPVLRVLVPGRTFDGV